MKIHQKILSSFTFYFLFLFCLSCNFVQKEKQNIQPPPPPTSIVDSAALKWQQLNAPRAGRIDSFFQKKYQNKTFNGTVLFAEEGKVVFKNAYGYADIRSKDTLKLSSPFQLASVSKPLTATAILMLYDRGLLDLNDTLQQFFPEFPYEGITVKLLLTHRSGLPNYMYFSDELWIDREVPISNEDVVCLMEYYQPDIYYIPDYRYNYSNTGYCLLAAILEKVTGKTFAEFMQQEVFEPLEMKNSFVYNKCYNSKCEDGVCGYNKRGRKAEDSYLNGVVGDKGIYSTAEDLFKFDRALSNGKLLSDSTLKKAFIPRHRDLHADDNYGFGWRINTKPSGERIVWHTGWWKGFRTYFIRDLSKKYTIIVLNNTTRGRFLKVEELLKLMGEPIA